MKENDGKKYLFGLMGAHRIVEYQIPTNSRYKNQQIAEPQFENS